MNKLLYIFNIFVFIFLYFCNENYANQISPEVCVDVQFNYRNGYHKNRSLPNCIKSKTPFIGILAQELPHDLSNVINSTSYIASSYVKFVESAGARVVPILINKPKVYYEILARKVNGFLFPGGSLPIDSRSGFGRSGKIIIDIVKEMAFKRNPVPIWGTCLGFEMILFNFAKADPRQRCLASNIKSKLSFHPGFRKSRLFENAPTHLINNLSKRNLTSNFHKWCIRNEDFSKQKLKQQFRILTTSIDEEGIEYVSTVEHRYLPLYGTQWHPEKSQFEWPDSPDHINIPHELEAIEASQYLANFFVQQCRYNSNYFGSVDEENSLNIHNHPETFLAPLGFTIFQQGYFFQ